MPEIELIKDTPIALPTAPVFPKGILPGMVITFRNPIPAFIDQDNPKELTVYKNVIFYKDGKNTTCLFPNPQTGEFEGVEKEDGSKPTLKSILKKLSEKMHIIDNNLPLLADLKDNYQLALVNASHSKDKEKISYYLKVINKCSFFPKEVKIELANTLAFNSGYFDSLVKRLLGENDDNQQQDFKKQNNFTGTINELVFKSFLKEQILKYGLNENEQAKIKDIKKISPTNSEVIDELIVDSLINPEKRNFNLREKDSNGITVLEHLYSLATKELDVLFTKNNIVNKNLLSQALFHIYQPNNYISQGNKGTCGPASLQLWLVNYSPAAYLDLANGLVSPGRKAKSPSGEFIEASPEFIAKDDLKNKKSFSEALSNFITRNQRDDLSRIIQSSLMEKINGELTYDSDLDHHLNTNKKVVGSGVLQKHMMKFFDLYNLDTKIINNNFLTSWAETRTSLNTVRNNERNYQRLLPILFIEVDAKDDSLHAVCALSYDGDRLTISNSNDDRLLGTTRIIGHDSVKSQNEILLSLSEEQLKKKLSLIILPQSRR